jgi:hypothetical protein
MKNPLIDALQADDRVLCWTAAAGEHLHWATHPNERRRVEARWMKRGGYVRCRWHREGTDVTWESQHDLAWLGLALEHVHAPVFRRRGTIRVE